MWKTKRLPKKIIKRKKPSFKIKTVKSKLKQASRVQPGILPPAGRYFIWSGRK